jgi:hypothetical protein
MIKVISGLKTISSRATGRLDTINISVMALLREASCGNLFWTMVLTGSIGMAVSVVFISYASHIAKAVISH